MSTVIFRIIRILAIDQLSRVSRVSSAEVYDCIFYLFVTTRFTCLFVATCFLLLIIKSVTNICALQCDFKFKIECLVEDDDVEIIFDFLIDTTNIEPTTDFSCSI